MPGNGLRLYANLVPVVKLPLKHSCHALFHIGGVDHLCDDYPAFVKQFFHDRNAPIRDRRNSNQTRIQFRFRNFQGVPNLEGSCSGNKQLIPISYSHGNRPEGPLLEIVVGIPTD